MFYLIVFLSGNASASAYCEPAITLEHFEQLLTHVKDEYYPELKDAPVEVATFTSDAYFLQAQPVKHTLLKKHSKRRYRVELNLKLLECPPTDGALQAILAHELQHVVDYEHKSATGVIGHGLKFVLNKNFREDYERETDLKTMQRGFAQGLKLYRHWVYQWLNPKQLETKKRYYFTPDEITEWQSQNN